MKKMKDYYSEIDSAIKRYENYEYPTHKITWICNRIDWCWKFRHITASQMGELVDRVIKIMSLENFY
jgi:hypothetical protein